LKVYSLEDLSSIILDEFKRKRSSSLRTTTENSLESSSKEERVYYTKTKSKKAWKKPKGKFCTYCKKPSHSYFECFHLHPNLKPYKVTKKKGKEKEKEKQKGQSKERRAKRKARKEALLVAIRSLSQRGEKDLPLEARGATF